MVNIHFLKRYAAPLRPSSIASPYLARTLEKKSCDGAVAPSWRLPGRAATTRPGERLQKAMENGPVEIVDFPIKNSGYPYYPLVN